VVIIRSGNNVAETLKWAFKRVLICIVWLAVAFLPLMYALYEVSHTPIQNRYVYLLNDGVISTLFWWILLIAGHDTVKSVILPFFTGREQKKQVILEAAVRSVAEEKTVMKQEFTEDNASIIYDFVGRKNTGTIFDFVGRPF